MIAIDTSSIQRKFRGEDANDTQAARQALRRREAVLPPPVVAEVFSYSGLTPNEVAIVLAIPLLTIKDGFWVRAGLLRRAVHALELKANLPDVLIAQICIDHGVALITHDPDFRHFVATGLKLA